MVSMPAPMYHRAPAVLGVDGEQLLYNARIAPRLNTSYKHIFSLWKLSKQNRAGKVLQKQ